MTTNPIPTQQETLDELCPWCAGLPDVHDKNNLKLRYLGCPTKGCIGREIGFIIDSDWNTRAAVAEPPGDALDTLKLVATTLHEQIHNYRPVGDCLAFPCNKVNAVIDAATASPAPAESAPTAWTKKWPKVNGGVYWRRYLGYEQPTQPEICILHGSYLDDFNGKSIMSIPSQGLSEEWEFFGPITAPPERTREIFDAGFSAETTRVAGGTGEIMANEEMLCCSCGQRVPKAIVADVLAKRNNVATDSARRAAEEICAYFGDTELAISGHVNTNGVATIISKHFAAAPADNDAESLGLLRTAAVLCISGDGQPRVSLLFKELKDAQAVHGWLVRLVHGKSTTKGDRQCH